MYKLVVHKDRRRVAEGLTSADITNGAAVNRAMELILRQAGRRERVADCWAQIYTVTVQVKTDRKVGDYWPGEQ